MSSEVYYFSNNIHVEIYDKDIILFDNLEKTIYCYELNYKNIRYPRFNSNKNYKKFLTNEIKNDNVSVLYNDDYNTYILELKIAISEYAQPEYVKLYFIKINFDIYSKLIIYYNKKILLTEEIKKLRNDFENYKSTFFLEDNDLEESDTISNDSFS
jgi:hypothetical protein